MEYKRNLLLCATMLFHMFSLEEFLTCMCLNKAIITKTKSNNVNSGILETAKLRLL